MAVRLFVCDVFVAIDSTLENCVFSVQFVRRYTFFFNFQSLAFRSAFTSVWRRLGWCVSISPLLCSGVVILGLQKVIFFADYVDR